MKLSNLQHAVLPGSILAARPLPRPPLPQGSLLGTLAKFLNSLQGIGDLRTELLHVGLLLRENQFDSARLRLDLITTHLREIRRGGTQFVLSREEWESTLAAGNNAWQAAELSRAHSEIAATLQDILDTLAEFATGRTDRSPLPA